MTDSSASKTPTSHASNATGAGSKKPVTAASQKATTAAKKPAKLAVKAPAKKAAPAQPKAVKAKAAGKKPATTAPAAAAPSVPAVAAPPAPMPHTLIGRIPVLDVSPVISEGRWATKAVVGEMVPVTATVFREGHDAVAATAVLVGPDGQEVSARMYDVAPGLDHFEGFLAPTTEGAWGLRVEGWSDPYATWVHNAEIKIAANIDEELMLAQGIELFEQALSREGQQAADIKLLQQAVAGLLDASKIPLDRLAAALTPEVRHYLTEVNPVREFVTPSATYPMFVSRTRAMAASWYEFFPRTEGAKQDPATGKWTSGNFASAGARLPDIAAMGFDTIYLTPIHPIGTTNRKGRNNTLEALPADPGSPYAIGSADGGHDAIHPDLGTVDDFKVFVDRAQALGMDVALDIALQCSPDHPWVTEHPQWFTTQLDGTIAYAENPPKKYQDIYPLNFDNDPEGIYQEILRVVMVWVDLGVTAFRVDNPHTKNLDFWERLLTQVRATNPEVIFLAEAFTKPAMMHTLAKIGFHQSYTYFTWRNTKEELESYIQEVTGPSGSYMRPSFWPTTHDILPPFLQHGGIPAFALRAVIAATSSPLWGIYSGYELAERVPRPGAEEQIDNEKYQYKDRDWSKGFETGLTPLLTKLNAIRNDHPALRQLRNVTVHPTSNDSILAFSSHLPAKFSETGRDNTIITVVNLDPHNTRDATVWLDLSALGVPDPAQPHDPAFTAYDLLSEQSFVWGATPFVRLDPIANCAHIIHVRPL